MFTARLLCNCNLFDTKKLSTVHLVMLSLHSEKPIARQGSVAKTTCKIHFCKGISRPVSFYLACLQQIIPSEFAGIRSRSRVLTITT